MLCNSDNREFKLRIECEKRSKHLQQQYEYSVEVEEGLKWKVEEYEYREQIVPETGSP